MRRRLTAADLCVYGLILLFAALQLVFYLRSSGFLDGEVTYLELARSIIEKRPYGFDYRAETRFPPGFPLILALMSPLTGLDFGAMVQAMTLFTVLAFVASYEVLLREEGRFCAGLICLVLISSPQIFAFATRTVFPELPYLLFTFVVLLTSRQLEVAEGIWERTALWLGAAFALVASLMLRSAALALLVGLTLWLTISFLRGKRSALSRLRTLLPLLILGIFIQALWTYRGAIKEVEEWPLNGYPGTYFSEILLKRGNYPELGNASVGELLLRLGRNLVGYGEGLTAILSRKDYFAPLWFSPAAILPLLLIGTGVVCKVRRTGGALQEWYFVSYMAMFLLWPWNYELRFLLPVTPLACLYLWSGIKEVHRLQCSKPRIVGLAVLLLATLLTVYSAIQGWKMAGVQPKLAAFFWLVLSIFSTLIVRKSSRGSAERDFTRRWFFSDTPWLMGLRVPRVHMIAVLATLSVVTIGFLMQVRDGQANSRVDWTRYPDIEAARYVDLHAGRNSVVMARHMDIVYHYCRRRVIWFPPISDPQILMDGIRKHKVEFIIVVENSTYWLPSDVACFQGLLSKYPEAFDLVYHAPRFYIYKVAE